MALIIIVYFYRDPHRETNTCPSSIISPADGTVIKIGTTFEKNYFKSEVQLVRIFLSVFNVHVNRAPIAGQVAHSHYFPGKHLIAFNDKASEDNERMLLIFKNSEHEIGVLQIAGLLARRIVNWVTPGASLTAGERYGMIKLGSCVEVYLPPETILTVREGDKVHGGTTVIGKISANKK